MATTALQFNEKLIPIDFYQRNVEELTNLITDHSPRFRRIALAHLGNVPDAEDAFQDAVLAALTHVDQFRGHAKMSTWLTAIVINAARMKRRRRLTQTQFLSNDTGPERSLSLADLVSDMRPNPEEAYRTQEITKILAEAFFHLSPTLLRTFQLRDIHGLSIRESARHLGVPPGTVKARTARARKKLKELMQRALKPVAPNQTGVSLRRIS